MNKDIYLMCGVAGSGKSTWANAQKNIKNPCSSVIISRDEIRFSLVSEYEGYFSKEDLVFETFVNEINKAIENPEIDCIYIDATHISKASRRKLFNRLSLGKNDEIKVTAVNFIVDLNTILERNAQREGRKVVPEKVIRNMYNSFVPATTEEENIDFILEIKG